MVHICSTGALVVQTYKPLLSWSTFMHGFEENHINYADLTIIYYYLLGIQFLLSKVLAYQNNCMVLSVVLNRLPHFSYKYVSLNTVILIAKVC